MYPAYYIICVCSYEVDGAEVYKGMIKWKPKECRPILNKKWRRATDEEIEVWLKKTGNIDARKVYKNQK